jgi:hypothetical protein
MQAADMLSTLYAPVDAAPVVPVLGKAEMAQAVVDAIRENRLDDADTLLEQLYAAYPDAREQLVLPVMIAIQRGQLTDAWQLVNGLPDGQQPELKALCLRLLKDPSWYGYAEAALDSPDVYVQKAMRNLLGRSDEDDIHELLR